MKQFNIENILKLSEDIKQQQNKLPFTVIINQNEMHTGQNSSIINPELQYFRSSIIICGADTKDCKANYDWFISKFKESKTLEQNIINIYQLPYITSIKVFSLLISLNPTILILNMRGDY